MSSEIAPPRSSTSTSAGCLVYGLVVLTSLWLVFISGLVQGVGWLADQIFIIQGIEWPPFVWPIISLGHAFLLGAPTALLAVMIKAPRPRIVLQAWALAAGALALFSFTRLFPATWTQLTALMQLGLSGLGALCVYLLARWRKRRIGRGGAALPLALAAGVISAIPYLLWGALGSLTDSILNLFASAGFGLFVGVLLDAFLFEALAANTTTAGRDVLLGGYAASMALVVLGSGFGFNGTQLLLLIALPPLGFALAGLHRLERGWMSIAILTALATAAVLLFVDPDELSLILGGNEISQWAYAAAGLMVLFGLALSALLALLSIIAHLRLRGFLPTGAALLAGLAAVAVYFFGGQPGFYGERLFVILKDQADLSAAPRIADREERLAFVYNTLTQHADTTQANLRRTLDLVRADYQPYYLVNALEVDGGFLLRLYLSAQPEVDRVIDSPHLRPLPAPIPVSEGDALAPFGPQWNITSIGADRVWEDFGVTGQGIVVGQSDSGVDGQHPVLVNQYRGRISGDAYNWLDPWNGTTSPTDVGGHGTHTLGSILGADGLGLAPDAQWFGCVNLARNLANPPLYLTCLQFMLAPYPPTGDPLHDGDPTLAAHVINNSWGCPPLEGCDATSLQPAIEALRAAGVFVVASAGNEGPFCSSVSDPIAIYDAAFSVGAVDAFGNLAGFSSRGPVTVDGSGRLKPDLIAPGVDVLSSTPNNTYATYSGTSMAGPHVVGAVALLWSANPQLIGDIDRTEQILRETAQPYTGNFDIDCGARHNLVGVGLLDVYAAVARAVEEK